MSTETQTTRKNGAAALRRPWLRRDGPAGPRTREDEFTSEHHVHEPHVTGLPPLRSYVREVWRRREFALELSRTRLRAQHFDTTFGLNARGTLFTVQKALPLFNDGGSIFMTGSNASVKGYPEWSVYAASKAVLQAYARVWLSELKDRRIRVNVLMSGQVATPKQEELFDEETKRQFESLIPRGEMGRPEEIATVALFLASDDSSYVNGMELVADGGTTAI